MLDYSQDLRNTDSQVQIPPVPPHHHNKRWLNTFYVHAAYVIL